MNRSLRFFRPGLVAGLFVFGALALAAAHAWAAPTLTTLVTFTDSRASSSLVQGSDGSFYGTAVSVGALGGTVYKVTTAGILTTLVTFGSTYSGAPISGLLLASDGNFYGTTGGGTIGWGTVFKMTQAGALTTLYSSSPQAGLFSTSGGLTEGSDGNFYGTADYGGSDSAGGVYKITPSGVFTTFASFTAAIGMIVTGNLVQGPDGDFYGVTSEYGPDENGTVFKVTPSGTITVLVNFNAVIGSPRAGLVLGTDGTFYGTTVNGGAYGYGTVFKVTPAGVLTTLYNFSGLDGASPESALIEGHDGNFYGVTSAGGSFFRPPHHSSSNGGYGTVFEITPSGTLTTLASFTNSNGANPATALVEDSDGTFYGTTSGGRFGSTIFKLVLATPSAPTLTSFLPGEGAVGSTVTLTGTGLDTVTAVRFHDQSATVFSANAAGTQLTVTVPEGADKGTITVTNSLGSATTTTPFRITFHPVITSFSPTSGPVGTIVVISGSHLTGITRVRFHLADATVYSSNTAGTQLTVTVPPGTHTGTITLDNRNALATTSSQVFTVTP